MAELKVGLVGAGWMGKAHAMSYRTQRLAFDGKPATARAGVEAGYRFSVPPSIVRSPQKQKLVRHLPLEHLLLESDSPVLGPDRDVRNEPCNVWLSCREIAAIKGVSMEAVAEATTANARALFPGAFR